MNKIDNNWALAYTFFKEYKAELCIQALENNGIEAITMNKKDSSYLVGEIEIYVKLADLAEAKNICKKFEE